MSCHLYFSSMVKEPLSDIFIFIFSLLAATDTYFCNKQPTVNFLYHNVCIPAYSPQDTLHQNPSIYVCSLCNHLVSDISLDYHKNNRILASQRTLCASVRKSNQWMPYVEIRAVYCNTKKEYPDRMCKQKLIRHITLW